MKFRTSLLKLKILFTKVKYLKVSAMAKGKLHTPMATSTKACTRMGKGQARVYAALAKPDLCIKASGAMTNRQEMELYFRIQMRLLSPDLMGLELSMAKSRF